MIKRNMDLEFRRRKLNKKKEVDQKKKEGN